MDNQTHNKRFTRKLGLFGAVCVAMTFNVSAFAQTLDFKACVETALNQNPEMQASSARINQAQAALEKAQSSRLPQITLSMTGSRSDDALNAFGMKLQQRQVNPATDFSSSALNAPDAQSNFNTRIELLLPVWNGGKISAYEDQAQAMIEAAQKGDQAVQQYLTFNVYQAYEAVHAARAYVLVAKQAVETAQSFVKTTKNLVEQGIVVRSELLSAEVHQSTAEVELLKAQGQEQIALDTLKMLMNIDATAELSIGERVDLTLVEQDANELVKKALQNNLQLAAKRKEADSSAMAIDVAKTDYKPSFNVMMRKDWHDDSLGFDSDSYTVAGVFSWKITDFGVTDSSVAMATSAVAEKRAAVASEENKLRLDVMSSWRKLQIAKQQVKSNQLAVKQASEAQQLVMKRYKSGVATITEVLASETQLDKARADLVAAEFDVNVHKAKLMLTAGEMDIRRL
ncbi:TolC family protein [Thiomicrorhabdus sediminis]|uniref:TolC family protein n=2 Tax=Thiomicrorhabdus sediminis TaxID=2580412 RepID=A0A4V1HI38_9GAMM|nr:TolC family protein [Thiomicrorhabdus sediminis]